MVTLSYTNSFKFGYNGEWFNSRVSKNDQWMTQYDPIERPVVDFGTECINTAKLIRETATGPIDVLFSGGQDSEVCLNAFLLAGISVNVLIMRFKDGFNAFDTAYATKYCQAHNIEPIYVDLDICKFLETDAWDYAALTQCTSPPLLPHLWLIDQSDHYVVIGSGDVFLYKNILIAQGTVPDTEFYTINQKITPKTTFDNKWYYREHESIAALHRLFMLRNRDGCPGFFQYNPELVLSWLNEPEVNRDLSGSNDRVSTLYTKYEIYQRIWQIQNRPKFDGFEIVRHAVSIPKMRQSLETQNADFMQTYKVQVDDLRKQLQGDING